MAGWAENSPDSSAGGRPRERSSAATAGGMLAASLKVPLSAVRIASGERSRTKRVEVRGVTAGAVLALAR